MLHHGVAQVGDVDDGVGGAPGPGAGPPHKQRPEIRGAGGEHETVGLRQGWVTCNIRLSGGRVTHLEELPPRAADGDIRQRLLALLG